jgi:hypothetical protein
VIRFPSIDQTCAARERRFFHLSFSGERKVEPKKALLHALERAYHLVQVALLFGLCA